MPKKFIKELLSWGKSIVLAVIIAIFVTAIIVQPFTVSGSSMEPTLEGLDRLDENKTGDHIVIFKSPYLLDSTPKNGDIVVVDSRIDRERTWKDTFLEVPLISKLYNNNNESYWIKRVIGVAGDTLQFVDGKVYRNGEVLDESYIKEDMDRPFETITVPEDHVYVMGDNRNNSRDSRAIGPIPIDHVVGKAVFRYFPFKKIGSL